MTFRFLILTGLFFVLVACGDKTATKEAATTEETMAVEPEAAAQTAAIPRTASPEGASVFFIIPADGATLSNPVSIEFGIAGMSVIKAGDNQPNSGHHHLLIDTGLPDLGLPVPKDERHIHFGDGSITTEITLEPGQHTLQMLLGDYLHIPHNPPLLSQVLTITVE